MSEVENSRRRKKTGGRAPGVPNRVTAEARKAIADFVEGNAHRMVEWLDQVATGELDGKPNPAKAFELFQSVIEYHIPKLARQELVGDEERPLTTVIKWIE